MHIVNGPLVLQIHTKCGRSKVSVEWILGKYFANVMEKFMVSVRANVTRVLCHTSFVHKFGDEK